MFVRHLVQLHQQPEMSLLKGLQLPPKLCPRRITLRKLLRWLDHLRDLPVQQLKSPRPHHASLLLARGEVPRIYQLFGAMIHLRLSLNPNFLVLTALAPPRC